MLRKKQSEMADFATFVLNWEYLKRGIQAPADPLFKGFASGELIGDPNGIRTRVLPITRTDISMCVFNPLK
jgi:hypothetical protein